MTEDGPWRPKRRREARVHQSRPGRGSVTWCGWTVRRTTGSRARAALRADRVHRWRTLRVRPAAGAAVLPVGDDGVHGDAAGHLAAHGRPVALYSDRRRRNRRRGRTGSRRRTIRGAGGSSPRRRSAPRHEVAPGRDGASEPAPRPPSSHRRFDRFGDRARGKTVENAIRLRPAARAAGRAQGGNLYFALTRTTRDPYSNLVCRTLAATGSFS